jgi:exodeoxyribonuclease-3
MDNVTIATLNIGAASRDRARRIIDEWILPSSFDVYVLTETSEGPGTHMILSEMKDAGWLVFLRPTKPKDRGTAIVSRIAATPHAAYPVDDPAPGRAIIITLDTEPTIEIIGMYVPNRGNDSGKTDRKRTFLGCWLRRLASDIGHQRILVGDLNVVPPTQRPQFLPQEPFEYEWYETLISSCGIYDAASRHNPPGHESTWVAYNGEGYTYDHIMIAEDMMTFVTRFAYDHSTRNRRLSDHSAIVISVVVDAASRLDLLSRALPTKQANLF